MQTIVSIQQIKRDAIKAAHAYIDVNDACPWPFGTEAGRLFRTTFLAERNRLLMQAQATL